MVYVTTTSEFHKHQVTRMRLCSLGNPDVGGSAVSEMISGFSDTARHRDVCRMSCLTCIPRYKNRCCSATLSDKKTWFPRARVSETKPFQAMQSNPTIRRACCAPKVGGNCTAPPKWSDSDAVRAPVVIACAAVFQTFELHTFLPTSVLSTSFRPRKICYN